MGTVLVADDDPDIRALVVFKLEQAGHQVIAVADGAAAVEASRVHALDLVIIEVSMPGLDGFAVFTRLRADERSAQLPILILTARARADDRDAALAAGADAYVTKPFSPRELLQQVNTMLLGVVQAR